MKDIYKHTYSVSKPYIDNFRNAIDIGARFAQYARYLARDFDTVHCFEPRTEYRKQKGGPWKELGKNLKKITHYDIALGDVEKKVTMFGSVIANRQDCPPDASKSVRDVDQKMLDSFGFENVDYIKIDVEGHELYVLRGAVKTIQRCKPIIVIEQNHITEQYGKGKKFDARDFLQTLDYEVVDYDGVADYILKHKGQ